MQYDSGDSISCKTCKKELPIENFRLISIFGTNKKIPINECISCENGRSLIKNLKAQQIMHRLKKEAIKILGGKCICCGITEWWNLQVDHKDSIKKTERIREPSPTIMRQIIKNPEIRKKYQCLCWGCNMNKMTREKCNINHFSTF